jgi:dihydrofolate reductase
MSLASNETYQALIAPSEYDNLVVSVLKMILPGICKVCKTLFKDFIEDGHWKSVRENDQMRLKTASVPKHNKFSDTIFGQIALRQLNSGSSVSPGIY